MNDKFKLMVLCLIAMLIGIGLIIINVAHHIGYIKAPGNWDYHLGYTGILLIIIPIVLFCLNNLSLSFGKFFKINPHLLINPDNKIKQSDQNINPDNKIKQLGRKNKEFEICIENNSIYEQAIEILYNEKQISISYLQRKLRIGYNKSANIVERMEEQGIIGKQNKSGKRELICSNGAASSIANERKAQIKKSAD